MILKVLLIAFQVFSVVMIWAALGRFLSSVVLFVKAQAMRAKLCGMTSENEARDRMGLAKAYSDTEFFAVHDDLMALVKDLK